MGEFEQRLLGLLEMYLFDQCELLKELVKEIRELRYVLEEIGGIWTPQKGGK